MWCCALRLATWMAGIRHTVSVDECVGSWMSAGLVLKL